MDHLAAALPQLDLAGNVADLANRQDLAHAARIRLEKHEADITCLVLDQNAVGRARLSGR